MSMGMVLILPKHAKIFHRERSNGMYSTMNYFLTKWINVTVLTILYPVITSSISFGFLHFEDNSIANYFKWIKILLI